MIAVVLAAGASRRMGRDKAMIVLDPVGAPETTLLDLALAATAAFPTVVVLPSRLRRGRMDALEVGNDEPERGMTHSLRLALAAVARDDGLAAAASDGVLVALVDTPLVDAALVAEVARALAGVDVAHPARDGRPGHPVAFSAHALARLDTLAEGDTLRRLRDDPRFARRVVPIAHGDERPFVDLDDGAALASHRSGSVAGALAFGEKSPIPPHETRSTP